MLVSRYFCPRCGYEPAAKTAGYMYALDGDGVRVVCPSPLETTTARSVTGMEYLEALAAGRIGFVTSFVCLACGADAALDRDSDALRCARCGSGQLRTLNDLVGQACPRCRTRRIEAQPIGVT